MNPEYTGSRQIVRWYGSGVPTDEEFIDGFMKSFPSGGAGARVPCSKRFRKAVMEDRGYEKLQGAGVGPARAARPR